jgi:phage I-like protein
LNAFNLFLKSLLILLYFLFFSCREALNYKTGNVSSASIETAMPDMLNYTTAEGMSWLNFKTGSASRAYPEAAKPENWPPSLKKFVDRTYAQCGTYEEKKYVAIGLEKLINKVASEGRLLVHQWEYVSSRLLLYPGRL